MTTTNLELNALDASPVKPAFYSNLAFPGDTTFSDELFGAGSDDPALVTVHKEMAIDCPPNFVPVAKSKPFYPPLNVSASCERPSRAKKSSLMSILTSTSLNSSGFGKPRREKKYRVSPKPGKRKPRDSVVVRPSEELTLDQPVVVSPQQSEDVGQVSEEDSGTVCDGTNSYSIDTSKSESSSDTGQKPAGEPEALASQPDPVVKEEETVSKPETEDVAVSADGTSDQDFVASFERFAHLMTELGLQECLSLYGEIVQANLKFHLKPLASNLSQLTQEILDSVDEMTTRAIHLKSTSNLLLLESPPSSMENDEEKEKEEDAELSQLYGILSQPLLRALISTHDQIALRFESTKRQEQSRNQQLALEHQLLLTGAWQDRQPNKSLDLINLHEELPDGFGGPTMRSSEIGLYDQVPDEDLMNQEGNYLIERAKHYGVENIKLVNIEKPEAPLGATIRNRDDCIVVGRIVAGGAVDQNGLLHEDDEILEINSVVVRGKTISEVCDMLGEVKGIVSFLIIPNMKYVHLDPVADTKSLVIGHDRNWLTKPKLPLHIRALFNYEPKEDFYIPCKELGLGFLKGDILHVISQDDEDWWQAYRDRQKDYSLAGLIPSQSFQERRLSLLKSYIEENGLDKKKKRRKTWFTSPHLRRKHNRSHSIKEDDFLCYEEVVLYKPPVNRKRPVVLIGPHSIGRHELRKRLMQTSPSLFEVAVPHTTRAPRRDEVDGRDYHFSPRHIFEADIKQGRFVEHGEYEKNLYGTSREAIKKVIDNSKICILNLYPQALKTLRSSPDLMPYVVYIGPPNLAKLKELKSKLGESYRENDLLDIIDKGREIEEVYGHYFDKIIRNTDMDKTYAELFETISRVQSEENWVPVSWLGKQ